MIILADHLDMPPDSTFLPTPDAKDADAVRLHKLQQGNFLVYAMLSMSVNDPVSFNAVNSAKTSNLTKGCARTACLNLEKLFKPKSNATQYELESKFHNCSLTSEKKNPDEWFAELELLRARLCIDF